MVIFTTISCILMVMLLLSMMAKARPFMRNPIPGKHIKALRMGFWARIQIQQSALLAMVFVIGFGIVAGWLPSGLAFMMGAMTLVVLLLPMNYTFTTSGIALGGGIFRRWEEFSGVQAAKSHVVLEAPKAMDKLTLFANPTEVDQIFKKVKGHTSLKF